MKPIDKKTFVQEWVKDLRSGEYKQGWNMLRRTDNRFCCLGVAVKTAERLNLIDSQKAELLLTNSVEKEYGVCKSILGESNPWITHLKTSCWTLNDSQRLNFNQIADILEEEFCS
jgi:hypothetical protein